MIEALSDAEELLQNLGAEPIRKQRGNLYYVEVKSFGTSKLPTINWCSYFDHTPSPNVIEKVYKRLFETSLWDLKGRGAV